MPRLGLIFPHLAIRDGYNDPPLPSARPTFSEPTRSFCVALRSQPVDATAACKPFVNVRGWNEGSVRSEKAAEAGMRSGLGRGRASREGIEKRASWTASRHVWRSPYWH
jgi:hypothetical protein